MMLWAIKGKKMHDKSVYALANELYVYFIEYLGIKDKCITKVNGVYDENTDLGKEIYDMIEEEIIRNMMKPHTKDWSLLGKIDIKDRIKEYIKEYNRKKLN
jgi:uncharacterized protein YjgD (DUF1641 family)